LPRRGFRRFVGGFGLVIGVPIAIVGVVVLAKGMPPGIIAILFGAPLTWMGVRALQLRAVVTPREFVYHDFLRVQRVEIGTVAAVDRVFATHRDRVSGETSGGWCPQVRLKDGRKILLANLDLGDWKGRPSDEGLQLLDELRRVLHVGGETLTPDEPPPKGKRLLDG
jgi:hypothetical protein